EAWGVRPRSKEQRAALDLLMDPDVSVVALDGIAGTGKTILALAAGIEQVMGTTRYDRLAIYRPVLPAAPAELRYLPRSYAEKLSPWMAAVTDAFLAVTEDRTHSAAQALVDEMLARGRLSMDAITHLRGRTLQRQFVVVDEAQNLEPSTLKTILTRLGEDTKI